ncbi:MAG TPA: NifU family protein [Solirubrobacteraceae bacterium]|nr:NifU family protein [Solirubrobacteraceae bacterium]
MTESASRPLAITASALQRIENFRAADPDPTDRALSVRITGESDGEYVHALSLEPLTKVSDSDIVQHEGDLAIVVADRSVEKLRGATIDWSEDPLHAGFVVLNPNKPPPAPVFLPTLPMSPGAGPAAPGQGSSMTPGIGLDTDVARHVIAVLDHEVNPSIASHGGHAELAGIEGATAYLRLGGGCQGCGMATVTLSQGIEVAITQAVPEIDRVVDVTDHASGTNPYFEQAKK